MSTLDEATAMALERRRRHRDRQKAYYERNRERINAKRREVYARERALLEKLEESLEDTD